jgi:hypothetical protein
MPVGTLSIMSARLIFVPTFIILGLDIQKIGRVVVNYANSADLGNYELWEV